jgi:YD repeat-containing protein
MAQRDQLGRITEQDQTIGGSHTHWSYSYDVQGRLLQVSRDGTIVASYAYDENGNRTSAPGLSATPTYDPQDRVLSYAGSTYTYTSVGLATKTDTATGAITKYAYDARGNLRRVDLPDGRVIGYIIDPQNVRVAKLINGTVTRRWLYTDNLGVVLETDGQGVSSRFVGGRYFTRNWD